MNNMTKKSNQIFQRVEKKYLLSKEQYKELRDRLRPYMEVDQYGLHTICNIYFDTKEDELIRTSIEKPIYKEKLRLRSYGIPEMGDTAFLEIKKKYDGVVYKRRVAMPLEEMYDYLKEENHDENSEQILHEIDYFISYYKPVPKRYLAYDRIAMFHPDDPDLRITFDQNIRSRTNDLELEKGDYGSLLFNDSQVLMEIKVGMAYPLWLSRMLSEMEIYPISFSKYGNFYKKQVLQERYSNRLQRLPEKNYEEDLTCLLV